MTTHEAVLLGTFRVLVLAVRHVSAIRTRFGKRHGWEMRKYACVYKSGGLRPCSYIEVTLWRALVLRDPKMFGVEKGPKR